MKYPTLIGQKFGRLTVKLFAGRNERKVRLWHCSCICGGDKITSTGSLTHGKARSCGCLKRESSALKATKHGLSYHKLYRRWHSMLQRCENPKDDAYKNYGGRGINVCERWHNIKHFISDVGPLPSPLLTIDRVNNDGDYEPSNFRWATRKQQSANKRKWGSNR